jgi:hypothetical protein
VLAGGDGWIGVLTGAALLGADGLLTVEGALLLRLMGALVFLFTGLFVATDLGANVMGDASTGAVVGFLAVAGAAVAVRGLVAGATVSLPVTGQRSKH